MADDDVSVRFGAVVAGAIAGIKQVSEEIEAMTAPLRQLQTAFKEAGEALLAAFAVEKISEFVEHMAEMGEEVERNAAILGISTKGVQQLGYVAGQTGTSAQSMAQAIERMQVNLQKA